MTTTIRPADQLRSAAFQLRNPFHLPGLNIPVDTDLASALADWLDATAQYADLYADLTLTSTGKPPPEPDYDSLTRSALAVARQINTGGGS